jgi:hypothetical protein
MKAKNSLLLGGVLLAGLSFAAFAPPAQAQGYAFFGPTCAPAPVYVTPPVVVHPPVVVRPAPVVYAPRVHHRVFVRRYRPVIRHRFVHRPYRHHHRSFHLGFGFSYHD